MTYFAARRLWLATPLAAALLLGAPCAQAKDTVKIVFIGPLSGGVAANGLGGRNSTDLAVRLHNEDPKSKYKIELVVLGACCPRARCSWVRCNCGPTACCSWARAWPPS